MPNNQRQNLTSHALTDVLPLRICAEYCAPCQGKDYIAVQSLDGELTIIEQEQVSLQKMLKGHLPRAIYHQVY